RLRTRETRDDFAGLQVPEDQFLEITTQCAAAVRRHSDALGRKRSLLELPDFSSSGHVPNARRFVPAGGNRSPAVWGIGNGFHGARVSLEAAHFLASLQIPEAHHAVDVNRTPVLRDDFPIL